MKNSHDRAKAEGLQEEALRQLSAGDAQTAVATFKELATILEEANDYLGLARVWTHLAQIFELLKDSENSVESYRRALKYAEGVDDFQTEGIAALGLAQLLRKSSPAEARSILQTSQWRFSQHGVAQAEALALVMIGEIDIEQGNVEQGFQTVVRAFSQFPKGSDERKQILQVVIRYSRLIDVDRLSTVVSECLNDADLAARLTKRLVESRDEDTGEWE